MWTIVMIDNGKIKVLETIIDDEEAVSIKHGRTPTCPWWGWQ